MTRDDLRKMILYSFSTSTNIGSKCLNQCKRADVKFYDPFLLIEWLEVKFRYFFIVLPLGFSDIVNIRRDYSYFVFQLIL